MASVDSGVPAAVSAVGDVVLALDEGTTNTKALLVDVATGAVVASASRPLGIRFAEAGRVEQDATQIWQSTVEAARACLALAPEASVRALSISNQRETVVCWDRVTGEPLGPALGWQDARMAPWCDDLLRGRPEVADLVRTRTGLSLDPMFSAPKMKAAVEAAVAGGADPAAIAVGTVDSWLVRRLTGHHAIEVGNASRTLLLDLQTGEWDDELVEVFGLRRAVLPEVRASDAGFGRTVTDELPTGVPVAAVLADSHSALYHHGCTQPGTGKATFGTGSSIMTPTAAPTAAPEGIATTVAWEVDGMVTYAREGNIIATGSALDWMAATLGAPEGVAGGAFLSELAATAPDAGGAAFVPAFSGLGAPYWDRRAVGVLTGVTGGTRRAHLARAALDAVAHQVADVVEAMESSGEDRIEVLRVDGGATASRLLMQTQADLLARPLHVSDAPEASALGAATLARRSLGVTVSSSDPGVQVDPSGADPRPARAAWARAVARSRGQALPND